MAGVQAESRSICSPKVEPRLPLGRLRSTSQSLTIPSEQKKKDFWENLFLLFFFPGHLVSCGPSLLSVLCLSHLLSMPQTWHMPSPCPHPSIHVFTLTNPGVRTLLPPPKLTFFVFIPSFSRLRRPRRHCLCQDCGWRVLEKVVLHAPKLA